MLKIKITASWEMSLKGREYRTGTWRKNKNHPLWIFPMVLSPGDYQDEREGSYLAIWVDADHTLVYALVANQLWLWDRYCDVERSKAGNITGLREQSLQILRLNHMSLSIKYTPFHMSLQQFSGRNTNQKNKRGKKQREKSFCLNKTWKY